MTRDTHLGALQHWLLDAVTNQAAPQSNAIDQIILPSRQQSAGERLAVYQHAYLARLLEVLRELFPCTRFAVGDDLFDQFAAGYLHAYPPHSYTLARLADHLVEHFDATRPADWGAFVVELARLEQAIDRIFDAAGPEGLPPLAVPPQAADSLKLAFVPGFELFAFRFPVSSYFTEWKAGRQPGWPERSSQYVALFRRDYIVRRYELTAGQYELLAALQRGASLGEALASVNDKGTLDTNDAAEHLGRWFTLWAAERFFAEAV